ncbi:MAG TPA: hypothetical protein VHO03_14175 [Ignavibacteriales bacterium]|nr:hypothetical protein [Ignavibacteriales bacterium]
MNHRNNLFVTPDVKISEIILNNPYSLLMLEHLGLELAVKDKTVEQVCLENTIGVDLFLTFANLFNGTVPSGNEEYSFKDIQTIIRYLQKEHLYYLDEMYPGILSYIEEMNAVNNHAEIIMVEKFFDEYFNEVKEHLNYENEVVFPYIISLYNKLNTTETKNFSINYSASEYQEHHSNIEEKLTDLKNLLIKYLPQKNDQQIRRKMLFSLFELEYDLNIHTQIENSILIPLVKHLEKHLKLKNEK